MSHFWKNQVVMITGHTGFKGSWLTLWLNKLGAKVHGFALNPPTHPNLFEVAHIRSLLASDTRANLSDIAQLKIAIHQSKPNIIFHLAAQPLVRASYDNPLETLQTNVMGTANLLEAARDVKSLRAIIVITTDKVYANKETKHAYCEKDALGGFDLYSASKAAAEIITASYRDCFFNKNSSSQINIATARAGNVIGGGDWAKDRLIPDCLTAFASENPVHLRYPNAIRPWQHVLEPLAGYIKLAEKLASQNGADFARAWNFGPQQNNNETVYLVAGMLEKMWGGESKIMFDKNDSNPHEANLLKLDSTSAQDNLTWNSRWSLMETLGHTVSWYKAWKQNADMLKICMDQLNHYENTEVT